MVEKNRKKPKKNSELGQIEGIENYGNKKAMAKIPGHGSTNSRGCNYPTTVSALTVMLPVI